ncbi:MAG: hypothetical protein OIN85_02140 [Candidatus Methanoperedens sp.]|nr:hypothetical protein [Candidatus Methanoperedens sp.]
MSKLFLIPVISVFDVHDAVVRDWLNNLDDAAVLPHLESPFKLERYFPENGRRAILCANDIHKEMLFLLDIIDPQAVFLDIPTDLYELENKYNKRLVSPHEFWTEYYETASADIDGPAKNLYRIYTNEIVDKNARLIESKDRLPLSVVFYGLDTKSTEDFFMVYEDIFEKDGEFLLQAARAVNELMNLREKPKHLWYSPLKARQMAISYEETEKFYNELLHRLGRLLKFKVRDYIVKSLNLQAHTFISSYEIFLDYKIKVDEIKISNIIEGLNVLIAQSDYSAIAVLCEPVHYAAIFDALRKDRSLNQKGITVEEPDISSLMDKIKPFIQKNRIMQSDYDIALNILGMEKAKIYDTPTAILVPKNNDLLKSPI